MTYDRDETRFMRLNALAFKCLRRPVVASRPYATVSSVLPKPPSTAHIRSGLDIDDRLLAALPGGPSLQSLVHQYIEQSGCVLASSLPYESRPTDRRRPTFSNGDQVAMIAHCVKDKTGKHEVTVSSGFALAAPGADSDGTLIVTCAHTLEEARTRQVYKICVD